MQHTRSLKGCFSGISHSSLMVMYLEDQWHIRWPQGEWSSARQYCPLPQRERIGFAWSLLARGCSGVGGMWNAPALSDGRVQPPARPLVPPGPWGRKARPRVLREVSRLSWAESGLTCQNRWRGWPWTCAACRACNHRHFSRRPMRGQGMRIPGKYTWIEGEGNSQACRPKEQAGHAPHTQGPAGLVRTTSIHDPFACHVLEAVGSLAEQL